MDATRRTHTLFLTAVTVCHSLRTAKLATLLYPDGSTSTGALNERHLRHGQSSMHSDAGELLQTGEWIDAAARPAVRPSAR